MESLTKNWHAKAKPRRLRGIARICNAAGSLLVVKATAMKATPSVTIN